MTKIRKCSNCQQVKIIYAKGLCRNCYSRFHRRLRHPLVPRICSCGCGQIFTPKRPDQVYLSENHRARVGTKIWNKKHPKKGKYLGMFFCPNCGLIGSLYALSRTYKGYSKIQYFQITHSSAFYSPSKYQENKKKFGSPQNARRHHNYITKYIHNCYF